MDKRFEILLDVIGQAGSRLLEVSRIELRDKVSSKGGDDANMVTVYDVEIQNFLIEKIKQIIPSAVFFAEEQDNDKDVTKAEYCFVIDPIDGTTNFVHGYLHSCISVAMLCFGKPVFGAVYNPYMDEMFYAVRGEGAYLGNRRISVSDRPLSRSIVAVGTSPYNKQTMGSDTFRLAYEIYRGCSDVRRFGTAALSLCYVAAGRTDGFFELALSPWDFAASALIISEAGGIVTDIQGEEIGFSAVTSVVAAAPCVHKFIVETARGVLKQ